MQIPVGKQKGGIFMELLREEKATVTIHAVNTDIPDQMFTIDLSPDPSIDVLA